MNRIILIFLFVVVNISSAAQAKGACPDLLGWTILKSAWPTPEYNECEIERLEKDDDGSYHVLLKSHGKSRISILDDKDIWVRADVHFTLDPFRIIDLSWRDYLAIVPPSTVYEAIADSSQN